MEYIHRTYVFCVKDSAYIFLLVINGRPAGITDGAISCGGVTIGSGTVNIGDVAPPEVPLSVRELPKKKGYKTEVINATPATATFTPKIIYIPIDEEGNELKNSAIIEQEKETLATASTQKTQSAEKHDIQLAFKDSHSEPIPNYEFIVTLENGTTIEGKTDNEGLSKVIAEAEKSQKIKVEKKSSWILRDDNE